MIPDGSPVTLPSALANYPARKNSRLRNGAGCLDVTRFLRCPDFAAIATKPGDYSDAYFFFFFFFFFFFGCLIPAFAI